MTSSEGLPPAEGLSPAEAVVERALRAGRQDGCTVLVEDSGECEVRFANNTTTTNGVRRDRRVTVISVQQRSDGMAVGMARQSGDAAVDELVARAEAEAAGSPVAPDAAPLLTAESADDLGLPAGRTDMGILEPVVGQLGPAFRRAEAAGRTLAGFAEHQVTTLSLGTSTGIRRRHVQPTGALHLVGRGLGGSASAWAGAGTPDFGDVSIEMLEEELARRLEWSARREDLDAGRYEVILPPSAVADLIVYLVEFLGARDAEEGRSVFSSPGGGTRLGEKLAELPFELRSDPAEPGLECVPFLATAVSTSDVSVFDNGLPVHPTWWIREGVLERLLCHRAGASRSGTRPTPPVDNLVLELPGTSGTLDSLVAETERGLLLTCIWYVRVVDPTTLLLTGLTRDGVFLVRDGEVAGAVNNFRFNESPVDLLGRVTEASGAVRTLGRELGEWANRTRMPALRVPDFNMSSVSPAS